MKLKKEIYNAFTPPKPKGRDAFLSSISYPKLSFAEFILAQTAFIRKRVWVVFAAVLLLGIYSICFPPEFLFYYSSFAGVWVASALLPFLAMLTASEISRSNIYGMSEIETSCKYGVAQLIGARLFILGVFNFIAIASITVLSGIFTPLGIARSALFILSPYMMVNGISLTVLRFYRGQEGIYISAFAALAVCVSEFVFSSERALAGGAYKCVSILFLAAGAIMVAVNIKKLYNGDRYYGIDY